MTNTIKKEVPAKETSVTKLTEKKAKVKVITPLKDLVNALLEARSKIKILDDQYKEAVEPLKIARDQIQVEIMNQFKDQGVFSQRFEKATCTIGVRKSVVITNESEAIKDLKDRGLTDYVSESLNDLFHDSLAKEIAKGTTSLSGIEISEKEYLTVRTSEKADPRKLTTEPYKALDRS